MLQTERLILRPWEESDAEALFEYAKDPAVGTPAGWPPHQSFEESREILRRVLMRDETFAVCRKEDNRAIGSISLKRDTDLTFGADERELGYWLAKPFWGQGLMPEAAKELIRYGFEELGLSRIWAGYYDGNSKSRRVQEKCGFRYQSTDTGIDVPLMHETRTGHTNVLTREEWLRQGKKHPLIGVTALYDAELESLWMMPAYLERIREAGGTPILLPMTADESEIAQLVSVLDGILFAGGQDVSPALYETTDETGTVQPCPQRDAFEPTLLRLALKKDLPVFGICRGLQLINACCGGDLYQDLPLQRPSDVCHRQERPYTDPVHTVTLTADGGLRALLGTETLAVNSCHHQAIRTLAPGFRATAITPDGLMEAIEKPDAPFVWAVQWHPEMLSQSDAASRKLFERFVQACRERANRA